MTTIRIKKGYDIKIEGKPSSEIVVLENPPCVAVLPEKIPFVKPRLQVAAGDVVKAGSVLFVDKRRPGVRFLSPGGGIVEKIDFGPRRVIRQIVVKLDETETSEDFGAVSDVDLEEMSRGDLIEKVMTGGLWPLLRQLPFRDFANPEEEPPAIFVSLDATEPFQAAPRVYLKGKSALLELGIRMLQTLTRGKVYVTSPRGYFTDSDPINSLVTHHFDGCYPAGDPGTLLYHMKENTAENRSWYTNGQDLLSIVQLMKTGRYPTERILVLAGDMTDNRCHVKTRLGVPIAHILDSFNETHKKDLRPIIGGIFTGYAGDLASYMGFYETSLTMISEGRRREFLGFVRPGFQKPSYSSLFLSAFNRADLKMDCGVHGDRRACIACGNCNEICPVDILPQLTFKAVLADDVDEYLSHGLLDCVECGLCTYVCPSKIELAGILKKARMAYYKEQA